MPHIIIDGYNYIHRIRSSSIPADTNMDMIRRVFLDKFVQYKKQKGMRITVVFDAYNSFSTGRQRENYKGIDVVYSRENETADDVMIGWIREKKAGMVIVTSDRAIIDEAKRYGVAFVVPAKLEMMIFQVGISKDEEAVEEEAYSVRKKGNPRKLPKKLRKASKVISKI
ncbi:MAG: NYN domain-containing protein [Proteobacteria bacterium]|nr:NYN domain-containing protein [Pseudomonadota bacterium]